MSKYLLRKEEATELFCHLVAAKEEKDIESFIGRGSSELIIKCLDRLKIDVASSSFAKDYFREEGNNAIPYPFLMKELSDCAISGLPIIMSSKKLLFILKNIKLDRSLSDYREFIGEPISRRLKNFENTYWFLYYGDETPSEEGITQAVLSFLPFGRAEYTRFVIGDNGNGEVMKYTGFYQLYGPEGDMLKVFLKVDGNHLNLQLKIFIGQREHELALGTYDNEYRDLLCGAFVIVKIKDDSKEKEQIKGGKIDDLVKFIKKSDDEYKKIYLSVRDFFAKSSRSIAIMKHINTFEELIIWLSKRG